MGISGADRNRFEYNTNFYDKTARIHTILAGFFFIAIILGYGFLVSDQVQRISIYVDNTESRASIVEGGQTLDDLPDDFENLPWLNVIEEWFEMIFPEMTDFNETFDNVQLEEIFNMSILIEPITDYIEEHFPEEFADEDISEEDLEAFLEFLQETFYDPDSPYILPEALVAEFFRGVLYGLGQYFIDVFEDAPPLIFEIHNNGTQRIRLRTDITIYINNTAFPLYTLGDTNEIAPNRILYIEIFVHEFLENLVEMSFGEDSTFVDFLLEQLTQLEDGESFFDNIMASWMDWLVTQNLSVFIDIGTSTSLFGFQVSGTINIMDLLERLNEEGVEINE